MVILIIRRHMDDGTGFEPLRTWRKLPRGILRMLGSLYHVGNTDTIIRPSPFSGVRRSTPRETWVMRFMDGLGGASRLFFGS